jgi:hypothetical protein
VRPHRHLSRREPDRLRGTLGAIEDKGAGDNLDHLLFLTEIDLLGFVLEPLDETLSDPPVTAAIEECDLGVDRGDVTAGDTNAQLAVAATPRNPLAVLYGFKDGLTRRLPIHDDATL